ncbi:sulfite exporter TauE/SafE family protein [Taibaiella helva]|uniref:sulfite exporter TauE/SafE family protein n=1 Tax=Taibaiella helva TaxID=2301235 RepID=UPI000E56ABC1|nr:sulfite exporter TauE/SafE family protein [Taibaiella helva]
MNVVILISSFMLGLGGSLHCLGMCGPLALSVPFAREGKIRGLRIVVYYLGKAFAYGCLGALSGLLGKGIMLMSWQQGLSIAAGLAIILMVCIPALKAPGGNFLFRRQFSILYNRLQHKARLSDYGLLGFLNGMLPCGLVYTALAAALLAGGWAGGFTAMFLFGLGTVPALVLLVLFHQKISIKLRRRLRPASVILSVGIGLLLILRGLNLGIPYISPEWNGKTVKHCCSRK